MMLDCQGEHYVKIPHVLKAAGRYVKRHRAPIHEVSRAFSIRPKDFEDINPVRFGQKWSPRITIQIPSSRSGVLEAEKSIQADVRVYLDGSGIDGDIGAAAVLCRNSEMKVTLRKHLGSADRQFSRRRWLGCRSPQS